MNKIINVQDFDYTYIDNLKVLTRPRGNQGTRKKYVYKDVLCAFDIETTRIEIIEQSFMYIWQFQFNTEITVIGRTWNEFINFLRNVKKHMHLGERLCIFVHNLSYEFQFLKGIYNFMPDEVFALKSRKILKCEMDDCFEFRCSYIQTNMSLSEFTYKMNVEHKKLSGEEFNYKEKRFPWTRLTQKQIEYCVNDVLGLVEALKVEMETDNDNLYTLPLTSTGYVRRDTKKAMRKVSHEWLLKQLPTYEIYELEREAFRGGNTHANRFYSGKILHNVHSADRSSSYPDVVCNCKFPVSEFKKVGFCTFDELIKIIKVRKRAVIMRVALYDVSLRDETWGCPYLTKDKSRKIINGEYDNGRILSADYLETTITDIDLKIIIEEYNFSNMDAIEVYTAKYGKLPQPIIDLTVEYYRRKTELKDVDGEEIYYMKSKNKLNSIYGMMAQDPVKQSILFINGEFVEQEEIEATLLEKNNRMAFLNYAWGVWVTAWARFRLEEGIRLAHKQGAFVYCDTDSVKYMGDVKWEKYNNKRINDSIESGAFADDKHGITHYMGVYEQEHDMVEFSTLGAKKYCFREESGKPLKITIAGVNKIKGAIELENAGGIEAFKEGFIFKDGGGTESVYNDFPEVTDYEIDGHKIFITSNVVIKESEYTLGITAEYKRLLSGLKVI